MIQNFEAIEGHIDAHHTSYKHFRRRIEQRSSSEVPVASTPLATGRQCLSGFEFDPVCQRLALDSPPRESPKCKSAQDVTEGSLQGSDDTVSSELRPFAVLSKASMSPQDKAVMKLAAPSLLNDYYTNLLDCSCNGMIALALGSSVYLWNSETHSLEGHLHPSPPAVAPAQPGRLCRQRQAISSLCWSRDGRALSIGTRRGEIQLWDVEHKSNVRCVPSHLSVVGALSWKQDILSSGSVLGRIHHHDPRAPTPLVGVSAQQGGVCSLEWSPGDDHLASGSTDGLLSIWDSDITGVTRSRQPVSTMKQPSAVKAMGWCPWQRQLIATGGGWRDGELRIWDTHSGSCIDSVPTNSQICSLRWAEKQRALVTGHGLPHHHLTCWAWDSPSLSPTYQLAGHSHRVLHLALSPCGTRIVSAGADQCVHIWAM
ncbi:cell division cycle protein 20 homolog B-like [Centroberyx gerrardi]